MKKLFNFNLKRIISLILCLALLFLTGAIPETFATEIEDYQSQIDQYEQKIADCEAALQNLSEDKGEQEAILKNLNAEINAIEDQIDVINSKIALLDKEISKLNVKINTLDSEITALETQITDADTQITAKQKTIADTTSYILERLKANYIAGNPSTIEILLSSSDLSVFNNRLELLKQVSDNDKRLIDSLTTEVNELNILSAKLTGDKLTLDGKIAEASASRDAVVKNQNDTKDSKAVLVGKQKTLDTKYDDVKRIIAKLDKSSAAYKAQIAEYERQEEIASKKIQELIAAQGSKTGDTADPQNDGKMRWPMKSKDCYLSAPYGHYFGSSEKHYGIDICVHGGTLGQEIVAAQGGEIFVAASHRSYGNYIIIDHGSGLFTLYAHCQKLFVSAGETVSKGQKIALAGSTGNSTGPHLHFEVRVNNGANDDRVNPFNYYDESIISNVSKLKSAASQIDVVFA